MMIGKTLRRTMVAAVLLTACLCAPVRAWTTVPASELQKLDPRLQELYKEMPEYARPRVYEQLTSYAIPMEEFFARYSGYSMDQVKQDLDTSDRSLEEKIDRTVKTTEEGRKRREYLLELLICRDGDIRSYDVSQVHAPGFRASDYAYAFRLKDAEDIRAYKQEFDRAAGYAGRSKLQVDQLPIAQKMLDAYIKYLDAARTWNAADAAQKREEERQQRLSARLRARETELTEEQWQLVDDMPALYKAVTYAFFAGSDGLDYLNTKGGWKESELLPYFEMNADQLSLEGAKEHLTGAGAGGRPIRLIMRLFLLQKRGYCRIDTNVAGTDSLIYSKPAAFQNMSAEQLRQWIAANSGNERKEGWGDLLTAANLWLDYRAGDEDLKAFHEQEAADAEKQRQDFASGKIKEVLDDGAYKPVAVGSFPFNGFSQRQRKLIEDAPACYRPALYLWLGVGGKDLRGFFREYTVGGCRDLLAECLPDSLALSQARQNIEEEYLNLSLRRTLEGKLPDEFADRLELLRELLIAIPQEDESDAISRGAFCIPRFDHAEERVIYEKSGDVAALMSAAELERAIAEATGEYRESSAAGITDTPLMDYITLLQAIRTYRAAEPHRDSGNWFALPQDMDPLVEQVVKNTVEPMRVCAYMAASGMSDGSAGLWREQPELLTKWKKEKTGDQDAIDRILALYGPGPWRKTDRPGFFSKDRSEEEKRALSAELTDSNAVTRRENNLVYYMSCAEPEFISADGNYHQALHRMDSAALYSYRSGIEQEYYKAPADRAGELKQWLDLIDAWIALRGQQRQERGEAGPNMGTDPNQPEKSRYTYLLEVSTGGAAGQKVEFFRIVYRDNYFHNYRTALFFPTEDSLRSSYAQAAKVRGGRPQTSWIETNLGYAAAGYKNAKPLQSNHTDQYLVTTNERIGSVIELQVFVRRDGDSGKNSWTCTGCRFYRVDAIYGLDCYGYYSSDYFIDFSGEMLAEATFSDDVKEGEKITLGSSRNLNWMGGDTLFRFRGENARPPYGLKTEFGLESVHTAMDQKENLALRVDFADKFMMGLECLAPGHTGARGIAASGNVCEAMALRVHYRDRFGAIRQTTLPLCTSAAAWLVLGGGQDGRENFAGLAQQGESMALPCLLPDYQELVDATMFLGSASSVREANLTALKDFAAAQERDRRAGESDAETVGVTCVALYSLEGAELSARNEDGFRRVRFPASPLMRYVSPGDGGLRINGGGSGSIALEPYRSGMRLSPAKAETEQYLVTLYTDNVAGAGSSANLSLRLKYRDVDGKSAETNAFQVRELANEFYGWWPASRQDFGYYYGLSTSAAVPEGGAVKGNALRFLVPVSAAVDRFTGASLDKNGAGSDEWQLRNLTIQTVEQVGQRRVDWQNVNVTGGQSDRVFDRAVSGTVVFSLSGEDTLPKDRQDPERQEGADGENAPDAPGRTDLPGQRSGVGAPVGGYSGPILIQGNHTVRWDIESAVVDTREELDWRQLAYHMTFADAMRDLGFTKTRGTYTVEVAVASDVNNVSDDDCGSLNQFYFQLLFEGGGKSGMVLANQQLESDGFHSGATESFTVTTTQEFGAVTGVRVIAEDMASDSNKYDKLKIDSITVKKTTDGQTSPLWRAKNVGWVGIDYRDEGEKVSLGGARSRTMEQMSHVYPITETSVAVNVQISISTGQYRDAQNREVPQFQGELSAAVWYRTNEGRVVTQTIPDVVERMYQFNNRAGNYSRITGTGDTVRAGRAVSDPLTMFRANHTDRFELSLDGLEEVLYITFYPRSTVQTTWNITDVSVNLIHGQGQRALNVLGEYFMRYESGKELERIARCTSVSNPKYSRSLLALGTASATASPITVNFDSTRLDLRSVVSGAAPVVKEVPDAGGDTLNVVLYPDGALSSGAMSLTARYVLPGGSAVLQNSMDSMSRHTTAGEEAYYCEGLAINGADSIRTIAAQTGDSGRAAVRGGFAQIVRGNVVVDTFELGGQHNLEAGMEIPIAPATGERQRVTIQFGPETQEAEFVTGKTDVGVFITYRADGPIQKEYQSPTVLLSKSGVRSVRPGQIVDLTFRQGHVKEITGVTVREVGALNLDMEGAYAVNLIPRGEADAELGRWSFSGGKTLSPAGDTAGGIGVQPMILRLTTKPGSAAEGGGTAGAVAMTVGYRNAAGEQLTRSYADIRPYITGGERAFRPGETTEVKLLVDGVRDVRWIELAPAAVEGSLSWNLGSIRVRLGDDGVDVERAVPAPLKLGTVGHYSFANIQVTVLLSVPSLSLSEEGEASGGTVDQAVTNSVADVKLRSGQSLRFAPEVTGSDEGFEVKLYGYNRSTGALGEPQLGDTRGYTEENLTARADAAAQSGNSEEAAFWRNVKPEPGRWETGVSIDTEIGSGGTSVSGWAFTPPRNYATAANSGVLSYRIVVSSKEDAAVRSVINVEVDPENDPVAESLERLLREQERKRQEELQKRIESLETAQNSAAFGSGGGEW